MSLHYPAARGDDRSSSERPHAACSARIRGFLEQTSLPTPFLVVDVAEVIERSLELQRALPDAAIYYAAKANPLPDIIRALAGVGSCFDIASRAEIAHCLGLGVSATRMSFGHTVKKASAIADAHALGITAFACDSLEELDKIARHAPGADVLYERTPCYLPADLRTGDRVQILSAGAYTHTYSAVGFNGFSPLHAVCINTTGTQERQCILSSVP